VAPENRWRIIETPCFPNKYKIVNDYYKSDNSGFFASKGTAENHMDHMNAIERGTSIEEEREKRLRLNEELSNGIETIRCPKCGYEVGEEEFHPEDIECGAYVAIEYKCPSCGSIFEIEQ
jgi:DNA-directed RNA polymerase subunit RPC12/RpoP